MEILLKVLSELVKTRASDLHMFPGETTFVRRGGILDQLAGIKFTEDEVKKIILASSSSRGREILGKFRQVNYAFETPNEGRFRFSVFFDKGKFGVAIRLIPLTPPKLAELGLPDPIKKVLSKPSGLIIVGSPSGQGKTTTIASLLDFINTHFEKSIFTVENPVEIRFKDERSAFIQRSIPLDTPNFFEGLNEAYRLDPDVVMTDSINYRDALDQSLFLCESGRVVIGATEGGNCQQILERIIYSRPSQERDSLRGKIATHLSMIISQKLIPRSDTRGRVAVFDILVNTPQIRALIKSENLVMFKTIQEQDHASGMQTFDRNLVALVQKSVISSSTATLFADDSQEMASRFSKK